MAVELLNNIPELAWTLNPLRVEMRSDLTIEQAGQLYVGYLYFHYSSDLNFIGPVENDEIMLYLNDQPVIFVFKTSPTFGRNELPTYDPISNISDWFERLRDFFLNNEKLNSSYNIDITSVVYEEDAEVTYWGADHYLRFTSKERDSGLSLRPIIDVSNGCGFKIVSYAKDVLYRRNLKIYVELWAYDGVNTTRLLAVNMPTDESGKAVVDISNLLHMHASLRIAEQSSTAGVVQYYLSYTDVYGEQQVSGNIQKTADKYALYGGVPSSRIGESVTDSLVKDGLIQWLSPKDLSNEVVVRGQEYLLTLFNPLAAKANVKVCAMLYYAGNVQHEIVLSTVVLAHYEKIKVDAMHTAIQEAYPEENLLAWAIYLRHEDAIISNVAGFSMQENPAYVYSVKYINSYGATAYANLYGKAVKGYGVEMESAELLGADGLAQTQSIAIQLKDKHTLRTGYVSRAVLESWRDFMLSTSKSIRVGNSWQPIVLKGKEVTEIVDGVHLYALEFEVESASYSRVWGSN